MEGNSPSTLKRRDRATSDSWIFPCPVAFEKLSESRAMRRGRMRDELLTGLNGTPKKATANGVL